VKSFSILSDTGSPGVVHLPSSFVHSCGRPFPLMPNGVSWLTFSLIMPLPSPGSYLYSIMPSLEHLVRPRLRDCSCANNQVCKIRSTSPRGRCSSSVSSSFPVSTMSLPVSSDTDSNSRTQGKPLFSSSNGSVSLTFLCVHP